MAFSRDSRRWFVGSAVGFILQVSLSLGQRGLHYIILSHVQLRMLLDVLAHHLLEYVKQKHSYHPETYKNQHETFHSITFQYLIQI